MVHFVSVAGLGLDLERDQELDLEYDLGLAAVAAAFELRAVGASCCIAATEPGIAVGHFDHAVDDDRG